MGWRGQDMLGVVSTRQLRPKVLFSLMAFRCHNLLDRTFDPLSVSFAFYASLPLPRCIYLDHGEFLLERLPFLVACVLGRCGCRVLTSVLQSIPQRTPQKKHYLIQSPENWKKLCNSRNQHASVSFRRSEEISRAAAAGKMQIQLMSASLGGDDEIASKAFYTIDCMGASRQGEPLGQFVTVTLHSKCVLGGWTFPVLEAWFLGRHPTCMPSSQVSPLFLPCLSLMWRICCWSC